VSSQDASVFIEKLLWLVPGLVTQHQDYITSLYTLFCPPFTLTMLPKRTGGRPKDSRNLTEAQKGAIVALRQFSGTEFAFIAGAIGLSISTPQKFFSQVKKACAEASLEPLFTNLLATVNSTPIGPPGAQLKVRNGSTLSACIRDTIIQFGTYNIKDATC
jgi:hypothetical protein